MSVLTVTAEYPNELFRINVMGTYNVIEAAEGAR